MKSNYVWEWKKSWWNDICLNAHSFLSKLPITFQQQITQIFTVSCAIESSKWRRRKRSTLSDWWFDRSSLTFFLSVDWEIYKVTDSLGRGPGLGWLWFGCSTILPILPICLTVIRPSRNWRPVDYPKSKQTEPSYRPDGSPCKVIVAIVIIMSCVTQVKAALARFLFCCHALVTVWRVVSQVGLREPTTGCSISSLTWVGLT